MHIDTTLVEKDLRVSSDRAAQAEREGLDMAWCTETGVDVFMQSYEVARRTDTIHVGTAIAVALARTPMTVAYSAWNLADISGGRFSLGLGSQVKPHIERRYSMPWNKPVGQMREFVQALRAIWGSWRTGEKLDFAGEHYTHTLMSPFWAPHEHDHEIPVYLAAVGPKMVELAGELADGIILHAFTNRAYWDEVTLPALERGLAKSGRTMADLDVSLPMFMAMGDAEEQIAEHRAKIKAQLAFYGSTPSYRPVLEAVGFGDLQPTLTELSKASRWDELEEVLPDEFVDHFMFGGRPEEIPGQVIERWGGAVNRTSSYFGWGVGDPDRLNDIYRSFREEKK